MSIYDTTDSFDFSKLVLTKPTSVPGGGFFIRFLVADSPLYIQSPKSLTKQGILKNGKRFYTDLMFTNDNESFIRWMENLENHCHQGIFEHREKWFEGDMELHDVENYFTPVLKIYRSGKFYSIRVNINATLGKPALKVYDEDEHDVDIDTIDDKTQVMTILEIKGIKCSTRSFQIEVDMKQMMVLKPANLFDKCLLLRPSAAPAVTGSDALLKSISESVESPPPDSTEVDENIGSRDTELFSENIETETSLNQHEERDISPDLSPEREESPPAADQLQEIDFHLEELENTEVVQIKERNDVYYQMYKEAKKKAKIAREFALSSYLEAKEIKNKYLLDDIQPDSDGESDLETFWYCEIGSWH